MTDKMQIDYDWTAEDELQSLAAVTAPHQNRMIHYIFLVGLALVAISVLLALLAATLEDITFWQDMKQNASFRSSMTIGFGVSIAALIMKRPAIQAKLWRTRVLSYVPQPLLGQRQMTLDATGMHVKTPASSSNVHWSVISSIEHRGNYILFLAGDIQRFGAIPTAAIDDVEGWLEQARAFLPK
ncbi:MAG: hypothetical protein Alpg2KO_11990 [Alphaproteobacteria bacterium]